MNSQPMVPLDIPTEVWRYASAHYHQEQWAPAPNHHPEYRDVRAAFIATINYVTKVLWDWDRQAAKFVQDLLPEDARTVIDISQDAEPH